MMESLLTLWLLLKAGVIVVCGVAVIGILIHTVWQDARRTRK